MMSSRLRRGLATFALTAAVALLAAGPAQAARGRESGWTPRVAESRTIVQEVWTRLTGLWQGLGTIMDGNG